MSGERFLSAVTRIMLAASSSSSFSARRFASINTASAVSAYSYNKQYYSLWPFCFVLLPVNPNQPSPKGANFLSPYLRPQLFCIENHLRGALELTWKFGSNRPTLPDRGVAKGWTGIDMSTLLLPEVVPEIDTNVVSFYGGGRKRSGLELDSASRLPL